MQCITETLGRLLCYMEICDQQTWLKTKPSMVEEVMRLTVSETVVLAVITKVFWGSQEVLFYGRDGAIGVVIDPLPGYSALLKLSLFSPLQTYQELVDLNNYVARLGGASRPWTLNQAHTGTPLLLLLLPALNGTSTDTYYACTHRDTYCIYTHTSCIYKALHAHKHRGPHQSRINTQWTTHTVTKYEI